MRKLFLLFALVAFIVFCAISCTLNPDSIKPIEKYYGKGYVLAEQPCVFSNGALLRLKNADTIIEVAVLKFDALNLKVGDTLKLKNK